MTRLLVGLTGGLASGKSTVARWLAEAGCTVVDADRLVAELHRPGGAGAAAVAELFGAEMLTAEGGVDHAGVAARVFSDAEARRRLEAALHPLVRRCFTEIAVAAEGIVVLEATLLAESGFAADFDVVVAVEAPAAVRLDRAIARGMPAATAAARLAAQGEGEARRAAADRVVVNDGDLGHLRRQVDELVGDLRRELAQRSPEPADDPPPTL